MAPSIFSRRLSACFKTCRHDFSAPAKSWESERPLTEEAQTILVGYRQRKDCVLVRAGYVDLVGQAWSCVIQGDGWVDICVVRETDVGSSKVSVSRIENSMWEESLNAEGAYG